MTLPKKAIITLILPWVAVQVLMFSLFGIGHGGDTGRYLGAGIDLLHGLLPHGKSASYFAYDLFVAAGLATRWGEATIIAGQLLFSAVAAWAMYKLGTHLTNPRVGFIASAFYIGFLKLHPWNVYILTDSLFISLIIISGYQLLTARTRWQYVLASLLIVYTSLLRPDGIAVLLAAIGYLWYRLYKQKKYAPLTTLSFLVLLALPTGWYAMGRVATHETLLDQYQLGAVIWSYEPLYLTMPGPTVISDPSSNPLAAIAHFIINKPIYFLRLALTKLAFEVVHVRPFHTPLHNVLIIVTLLPIYWLAVRGWRLTHNVKAKIYFGGLLVFKGVIVAFTFADWTGRFLLHVLPIVLLFAAVSIEPFTKSWLEKHGLAPRV